MPAKKSPTLDYVLHYAKVVERALSDRTWDLGNGALYDLCRLHPGHVDDEAIIAKVWLIGRSYAAAIERGRADADEVSGDLFYKDKVAPRIRASLKR